MELSKVRWDHVLPVPPFWDAWYVIVQRKKEGNFPSARPNSVPGEKKTPNPVPAKYNSFRESGNTCKLIVK